MPAKANLTDAMTRHQVMLQRLSSEVVSKFLPFLRRMDRALRAELTGGELTSFQRRRVENQLKAVRKLLTALLNEYSEDLFASLDEIAEHEAAFSQRALKVAVDTTSGVPAASLIQAAVYQNPLSGRGPDGGRLLREFIKDWTETERNAVIGLLRRGIFQGLTNAEMVRQIRGTEKRNYQDGLLDITRRHAEAVVRTAVQHVSSMARQVVFDNNADLIRGVRWVSTLDARTCPSCAALDGKVFPIDEGPRPGLHPNCRCTVVPVLKGETQTFVERLKRASKGPEGGRQVPASLTYYEWLKQQPAAFQDVAIGPARAKLLRDGGLSAKRFAAMQMDRQFMPLTLEEMKRLEPLAFDRAGVEP